MTLQASGAISLTDIAEEFPDTAPHSLSEFYGVSVELPSSGAISFSDFYGTSYVNWQLDYAEFTAYSPSDGEWKISDSLDTISSMQFSTDGSKLILLGNDNSAGYAVAFQFNLSVPWSITSLDPEPSSSMWEAAGVVELCFSADGTKMYELVGSSDEIIEYSLSTAWDPSSATQTDTLDISSHTIYGSGLFFKPDGTKFYVTTTGYDIYEFQMNTAWDLTTAAFVDDYQNIVDDFELGEGQPTGIFIGNEGTKLYVGSVIIKQYTLTTAWDISTATYDNQQLGSYNGVNDSGYVGTSNANFWFKSDGFKVYVPTTDGSSELAIAEYTMTP